MLSVSVIGAGSEAAGYANYQESEVAAAREDYYSAEGDAGRWTGKATQKMGLTGDLGPGQLLAGLRGFHPETGEALSKNAGEKHKGGWDLTFSAPKSVSSVWAVAEPETRAAIESAQNAAAARALGFLEDSGAFISRSRTEPGPVEGIAAAMYLHGTSREADPQLHTHCAVLNLQPDGTAMDFDLRWKMAAGAVYRAEFAAEMQKMGFQIERDGKSFRIVGVPEAIEEEFSTRRQQIEKVLAAKGLQSAKAADVAAQITKKSKETIARAELFTDWETRAAAHGFDRETAQALRNTPEHELQHTPSPENGLDFIDQKKEQVHEQPDRYATDPDRNRAQLHGGLRQSNPAKIGIDTGVLRWAAFLIGIDPPPRARNHLRGLSELDMVRISDGSAVLLPRDVPGYVVQQTAERAADPLRRGSDGELDYSAILSAITQQASTFTPQQMAAAVAVEMQGKGGADAIQKALRDLQKHPDLIRLESEKPYHLRRGDPTEIRYTTREMLGIEQGLLDKSQARQSDISHHADTSAAIAARPTMTDEQKAALKHVCEDAGAVKIVEGMAGTGKSYLMAAARESWEAAGFEVEGAALAGKAASGLESGADINSKTIHSLLFQLDSGQRQLHSKSILVIDEGGMVGSRQLARVLDHVHQAGAKAVIVGDSWQLQAIDAGGAFRLLSQRLGAARLENIVRQKHEVDRQVVRLFANGKAAEALESMRERGRLKTTETRPEAMQEMVRDWARGRDPHKPGEALMLAATRAEVAQINAMARQMLKSEGRLAGGLQVPTAAGMKEFAIGDRIIFGKNNSVFGVKNGELGTVESIRFDKAGQVEITARHDNGKAVKFTVGEKKGQFEVFDYGYGMSVHKAQGVTVDKAFVLPSDSMSGREWTYVAASRARYETHMYITRDSVEALTKTMSRAQGKETSLDFKQAAIAEKSDAPELATSHDREAAEASPSAKKEKGPEALDTVSVSRHVADKAVDAANISDKQKQQLNKVLDVAELAAHIKTGNLAGAVRKAEDLQKHIHEEGLAP